MAYETAFIYIQNSSKLSQQLLGNLRSNILRRPKSIITPLCDLAA